MTGLRKTISGLPLHESAIPEDAVFETEIGGVSKQVRLSDMRGAVVPGGVPDLEPVQGSLDDLSTAIGLLQQQVGSVTDVETAALATEAARAATVVQRGLAEAMAIAAQEARDTSGEWAAVSETAARTAASVAVNSIVKNTRFSAYQTATGLPTDWYDYVGGDSAVRVAGEIAQYAMRLPGSAGSEAGVRQYMGAGVFQLNQWWVLEADVKLVSGSLNGAGLLLVLALANVEVGRRNLAFSTDADSTDAVIGAGVAGATYRFRKLIQLPNAALDNATFYAMSHHSGINSTAVANDIIWYYAGLRPATAQEVAARRADINATSALAAISSESSVRSNADTALALRADTLEATVGAIPGSLATLTSRITTEEVTRASQTGTLANRTTTLESTANNPPVPGLVSMNANPTFTTWPDGQTYPSYWDGWGPSPIARIAGFSAGYALRQTAVANGDNSGLYNNPATGSGGLYAGPGYYVIEATVRLVSGASLTGAGVLVQAFSSTSGYLGAQIIHFAADKDISESIPTPANGRLYRFRKLVPFTASTTYSFQMYAMNNWVDGFTAGGVAKTLDWYQCSIRPASDEEVRSNTVIPTLQTGITAANARITTEEGTRANADSALSSRASALESSVNNGSTGLAATVARITTEEGTRANADTALAARTTVLESSVNNGSTGLVAAHSRITDEAATRVNETSALGYNINSVTATVGGHTASLSTQSSAIANLNGRTAARFEVIAVAGSGRARLRVYADANGGGGVDLEGDVRISGSLMVDGSITAGKTDLSSFGRLGSATWSGTLYATTLGSDNTVTGFSIPLGTIPPYGAFTLSYEAVVSRLDNDYVSTIGGLPYYFYALADGGLYLSLVDAQGNNYGSTVSSPGNKTAVIPILATIPFNATLVASLRRGNTDTGIVNDGDYYIRHYSSAYVLSLLKATLRWTAF